MDRVRRTIILTRIATIPFVLLSLASSAAGVHDDADHVSAGEWLYLGALAAGLVFLLVIVSLAQVRRRNSHTGLSSPIRRRRARGPLSKLKIW